MKKIIFAMLVIVMASFATEAKSQHVFGIFAGNGRAGTLYIEDYVLNGSVSQTGATSPPTGLPFAVYSIHLPGGYGATQGGVFYSDPAGPFKPLSFSTGGSGSYVSVYNNDSPNLNANVQLSIASGGSTNSGTVSCIGNSTTNLYLSNLNKTFTSPLLNDPFGNPPNIIFAQLN